MLMGEYDRDMDIAVQREEAEEAGIKKGMAQGLERGREEGRKEGRKEGVEEGIRLTREAIRLHAQGKDAAEIAGILEIPEERARLMIS